MKRILCFIFGCCLVLSAVAQQSPNGKISITPYNKGLCVNYGQQKVLQIPTLGYEGYPSKVELSFKGDVTDDYRMLSGKRLHCTNQASGATQGADHLSYSRGNKALDAAMDRSLREFLPSDHHL